MATCAQAPFVNGTLIQGLIILCRPDYVPKPWHSTLLMWAYLAIPLAANIWCRKILPPFEIAIGITHVVFFIVTIVTLVATAAYSSNEFVWTTTTTGLSGWQSPGVQWCIGLLTPAFSLLGFDGVLHMGQQILRLLEGIV